MEPGIVHALDQHCTSELLNSVTLGISQPVGLAKQITHTWPAADYLGLTPRSGNSKLLASEWFEP